MTTDERTRRQKRNENVLGSALGKALAHGLEAETSLPWTCDPQALALALAGNDRTSPASGQVLLLELAGRHQGQLTLSVHATAPGSLPEAATAPGDRTEASMALVRSSLGPFKAALGSLLGSEVIGGTEGAPRGELRDLARFRLLSSQGSELTVTVAGDPGLATQLGQGDLGEGDASGGLTTPLDLKPKLERVIDVPLRVTLRFGQHHLTLREVLALKTGSLIELDRQVEEPVDLVLGDRLIARGEVVIVDGNYGLRVTEVVEGAARRIERIHARAQEGTASGVPAA